MPLIQLDKVQDVYKKVRTLNLEEKWELLRTLTIHLQNEEREIRNKLRFSNQDREIIESFKNGKKI
jgi:hypothetical protein